ncbi:MAG: hypothetical protein E7L32_27155, partial [Klebsiella michiganensis]|nr:hypothetical protein [Klebsiella michiganensis]
IICSPMTSLKTSIKTITYLSDIGCLKIQGASLVTIYGVGFLVITEDDLQPQWGLVENSLQFKINNHFQTLSASLPANNVTALKAVLLDRVCAAKPCGCYYLYNRFSRSCIYPDVN